MGKKYAAWRTKHHQEQSTSRKVAAATAAMEVGKFLGKAIPMGRGGILGLTFTSRSTPHSTSRSILNEILYHQGDAQTDFGELDERLQAGRLAS